VEALFTVLTATNFFVSRGLLLICFFELLARSVTTSRKANYYSCLLLHQEEAIITPPKQYKYILHLLTKEPVAHGKSTHITIEHSVVVNITIYKISRTSTSRADHFKGTSINGRMKHTTGASCCSLLK